MIKKIYLTLKAHASRSMVVTEAVAEFEPASAFVRLLALAEVYIGGDST
jgi:hypothetical protein